MSARPASPEGTLRLHRRFPSRLLGNQRDLVVWLPPGCDGRRRRHPVVYFHDGQNIFDPLTAFLGRAWHAGRAAAALTAAGEIVPPILVGIYNTGFDRMNEYAPTRGEFGGWDGERCRSRGRLPRYARCVAEEIVPFIDARYPTLPAAAHRAQAGSSMGGLAALYGVLWHPRTFGAAAALSPSVWWDGLAPVRFVEKLSPPLKPRPRVWLDTGTAEPGWENARLLRDALLARGWRLAAPQGTPANLHYGEAEGAEHTETAWSTRIGDVLRWVFPA